jgi:hypothetical protein
MQQLIAHIIYVVQVFRLHVTQRLCYAMRKQQRSMMSCGSPQAHWPFVMYNTLKAQVVAASLRMLTSKHASHNAVFPDVHIAHASRAVGEEAEGDWQEEDNSAARDAQRLPSAAELYAAETAAAVAAARVVLRWMRGRRDREAQRAAAEAAWDGDEVCTLYTCFMLWPQQADCYKNLLRYK